VKISPISETFNTERFSGAFHVQVSPDLRDFVLISLLQSVLLKHERNKIVCPKPK
jgi:hypothetical protein